MAKDKDNKDNKDNQLPLAKIDYGDKFADILEEMDKGGNEIAKDLINIDGVSNQLGITYIEVSDTEYSLDIEVDGELGVYKVGSFIREMFPNYFTSGDIREFAGEYESLRSGNPLEEKTPQTKSQRIDVPEFKYDPTDVKATFISLVTKTYPHPHEEDVMKYLPTSQLTKDKHGNYYKIIGKSHTMFTSHLDTADRGEQKNTTLFIGGKPKENGYNYSWRSYSKSNYGYKKPEPKKEEADDDEYIFTNGSTLLGADDKSGVTCMLYMMHHNVPGLYYFFIGEERGGIGSNALCYEFTEVPHLQGIKKCISFDRRNEHSVITHQMSQECCSEAFAKGLCAEFGKSGIKMGLDSGGVYTDSASFIENIPECTNVSVGYMHEHTGSEYQNISFLDRLCKSLVKIDWESLPVDRRLGFDEHILYKYGKFIDDFRDSDFNLESKFVSKYGRSSININMDEDDVDIVRKNLAILYSLLKKHDMDPTVYFDYEYIKIELA